MPQYRCRTHAPLTRPPHSRPDPCSGPRRPRSPAGTPAASSPPGSPHTPGRQRQNIQKGLSHALKPHIPSACRTAQGDRGGTDLIVHNRQEDAAAPIRPPVARPLLRHLGEERPLPSRNQDSINPNGIATKSIRTHASRLGLPYMCLCFGEGGHDGTPHVLPPLVRQALQDGLGEEIGHKIRHDGAAVPVQDPKQADPEGLSSAVGSGQALISWSFPDRLFGLDARLSLSERSCSPPVAWGTGDGTPHSPGRSERLPEQGSRQ
jgi:hypothetical protein